jgi:capsular polysaccharide transport system permease protein
METNPMQQLKTVASLVDLSTPGSAGALVKRHGADGDPQDAASRPFRIRRGVITQLFIERLAAWLPFSIIVVLPTVLAGAYFGVIAADRYVAEAQFVVRSAERGPVTGIGALLQSTGINTQHDDAFVVQAFMTSRDALADLERDVGYAGLMGRDEADLLSRWPNPRDGDSFEGLFDYFGRRVQVVRDLTTGLSTLRVEAFAPQDAQRIAAALLESGEVFVNRMNARALADSISLARDEVDLAEKRMLDSQSAFNAFRRAQGLVSPIENSELQMALVAELSGEVVAIETEMRRIQASAPNSPKLPALRARARALEAQVAAEKAKLVGADGALTDSYGEFESLLIEQKFAEEALLAARANLEQARADAQRKQRYLERVVNPGAPDDAREPRRLMLTLSVAAGALLLYAIGWLLYVNAREHRT